MSFPISREVWEHAPQDLSQSVMMVLLALADSAGRETRMTCLGADALADKTRASRRTTFRALNDLYERGILQNVTEEAVPQEFRRYRSDTRRITEVHHWPEGKPVADYVKPPASASVALENNVSDMGSATVAPNPYSSLRNREKTSSSPAAPPARRTTISRGHARLSRAEIRRAAAQADDERDPAKVFADELPGVQDRAETKRESRQPVPAPDSGMGLATYFIDAVSRVGAWHGLSPTDHRALAANINRWKAAGTSPDELRAMVDLYTSVEGVRNPRATPWKDFASKRFLLKDKIRHRFEKNPLDDIDHNDPASFAPKPPAPEEPDEDGYTVDRSVWS